MLQVEQSFFTSALISEEVLVFDWTSRKGPLKERNREKQTIVATRISRGAFPAFVWTERGQLPREDLRILDGIVDFHDVPSFSDRFDVAGSDRAGIRARFDAGRRQRLALPDGLRVEGRGEWLIGSRVGALISTGDIEMRVEEMRAIAEAIR